MLNGSKLLFDIARFGSFRYPFPIGAPTDADYDKTRDFLRVEFPALAEAVGPVNELTKMATAALDW